MAEKKPRAKRKLPAKAAKATGSQQPTLLALFGKRDVPSEPEVDAETTSDVGSNIEVSGTTPSPPRTQIKQKGKRPRRSEPSPPPLLLSSSPPIILSSSPTSSPPPEPLPPPRRATSTARRFQTPPRAVDSAEQTHVYESLRRSRARSVVNIDEAEDDILGGGRKIHPMFAIVKSAAKGDKGKRKGVGRLVGSQEAPIEVLEEDEGKGEGQLTSAAVHAFFKPKVRKVPATTTTIPVAGKARKEDGLDMPWPNKENVHAGSSKDARIEPRVCPIPRRTSPAPSTPTPISEDRTKAWAKSYSASTSSPNDILDLSTTRFTWAGLPKESPVEEIPEEHAAHPAIARLLGPEGAKHAFTPPARACEALGNEQMTQWLSDWLKSLALRRTNEEPISEPVIPGKPKERRVLVTQVDRRKRRRVNASGYDASWVIDDLNGEEEDENIELLVDVGNTFVITGPPGSGKSATVHACAQELGWSVFEVYAGIGKRGGGANGLASLIGSVGANHTMGGGGDGEVQQSLILLDEVDLIFEQDTQFWSTIVGLVRESRRPVVMTCNDLYCVPLDELPIQRYVEFQAPPPDIAASYLYAQARAAGCERVPSREALEEMYRWTALKPRVPGFAMLDAPQHPLLSQLDRSMDLRRALEELEFWVVGEQGGEVYQGRDVREAWLECGRDIVESVGDWGAGDVVQCETGKPVADLPEQLRQLVEMARFAEDVSVVDAELERSWTRQMQAAEVDRFAASVDDETRAWQVCKPMVPFEQVGIAEHCWDAEIALESLCMTRRILERHGAGARARAGVSRSRKWDSRWLEEVRAEHQEKLAIFLDANLVTPSTPLLPRPALILDMIPAVRAMVAADEALMAAESNAGRVVWGRSVRSARQAKYERYVALSAEELAAVKGSAYAGMQ
ncbi:hypothetical protein BDV93DRAFT_603413 [Ceratobasidium sp. AG-I]|nr:hypothetical protein BDV93DRAFT_603413 [Ceratobasidium sp. AG-I]